MLGSTADHLIKNRTSHAMSASGSATTSPREKLRLSPCSCSSTPGPGGNSIIRNASSRIGKGLIVSKRLRRKYRARCTSTDNRASNSLTSGFAVIRDTISIFVVLTCEAFKTRKISSARAIRIKPRAGQVRTKPKALSPIAIVICMFLSRPASAQTSEVITPVDLFEPERGDGVRIGPSLLLFPSIESNVIYDSNVYNSGRIKLDDIVVSLRPRSTLRTDLPRHQFSLTGETDIRRYADIERENSEQYEIQGKGIFDLAQRTEVIADGGFRRGIEQRGTAGDQFLTDEPVAFNRTYGGLILQRTGGFLELTAEGRIAETKYKDTKINGVPLDISDRDTRIMRARIQGSAPSSHYSRIFVQGSINKVEYLQSEILQRNSDGYALLAGMQLRLTQLVDLEVGVGYIRQNFKNRLIKDVSAVNFRMQVAWTPRPDWQITAAADRIVDPSFRLDAPAIVRSDFSLEARKTIGDRLLVSVDLGLSDEKYLGSGRKDLRSTASVNAHYRLTDNLGLIARVSWRNQNGNALGRNYEGVAAALGIRARI